MQPRPLRHGPCLRKAPQGPCLRCACPDGRATPSRPLRHAFCRAKAAPSLRLPAPKRDPLTAAFHGTLPPPVRTAAHMSDDTPAAARSAPIRSPGSGAIAHALPARPVVALVVALIIAGLTYRRLLGVPLRFAPGRAAPGSASLRPRAAQAAQNPRPPPRVALRPSASLTPPRSPARCASSACPAPLRAPLAISQCGPAAPRRMGNRPPPRPGCRSLRAGLRPLRVLRSRCSRPPACPCAPPRGAPTSLAFGHVTPWGSAPNPALAARQPVGAQCAPTVWRQRIRAFPRKAKPVGGPCPRFAAGRASRRPVALRASLARSRRRWCVARRGARGGRCARRLAGRRGRLVVQ